MLKKCLVLDLDNTLWGGIIGEDGLAGIKLGLQPPGSAFLAFQQVILDMYNSGVILAIASRNNFDDAMNAIRSHPDMILRENHFAATRINWNDKATNIRELAKDLNIGTDSMVFLDDDPVNRELVRVTLPEVETPDLPANPEQYAKFLLSLPYFEGGASTAEDKMRGNLYVTERLRQAAAKQFASKEDFLKSLETEVEIYIDDASCLPRLSQLTEKTNQFNSNKRPFSEEDIAAFIADPGYAVFYGHARDKFGDHGIIALALVKKELAVWTIESMLVSCRVIGKGLEEALVGTICKKARAYGANTLRITFKETEKNKPVKDFIDRYFDKREIVLGRTPETPLWIKSQVYER